jgi:hypothetical protein
VSVFHVQHGCIYFYLASTNSHGAGKSSVRWTWKTK